MGTNLSTEAIVIGIYGGTKWTNVSGRMLIGANTTYTAGSTGGTSSITDVPSHNHEYTPQGLISNHNHSISSFATTDGAGSHSHKTSTPAWVGGSIGAGSYIVIGAEHSQTPYYEGTTDSAGSHNHTILSHNTNYTQPTFTGITCNTEYQGSNKVSILNPYYAVFIWVRTA